MDVQNCIPVVMNMERIAPQSEVEMKYELVEAGHKRIFIDLVQMAVLSR